MATSGYIDKAIRSWLTLRVKWVANSQSVENNTTNLTVTAQLISSASYGVIESTANKDIELKINGTSYKSTCKVGISGNTTKNLFSKTVNVPHNADGTKNCAISCVLGIDVTLSGTWYGNQSVSGTAVLNTIPRASSFGTVTGNTIGGEMTVNITHNSSSFTHQLWYKVGNSAWYDLGTEIGTSKKFTIDINTCSQFPSATSGTLQLCLRTFNGTTRIGSDVYKNITVYVPDSVKPSVALTVTDAMGYADKYGGFIQTLSKFKIVSKPTLAYGSAIESYTVKADGNTYTKADVTTGVIKNKGLLKIESTVKDKRNRSGTDSETVEVLAYEPPIISGLETQRCDADGTPNRKGEYIKVLFSGAVTPLNNINSAVYTLEYKKASEDEYTAETLTDYNNVYSVENAEYVFAADTISSYNIRLTIADDFNSPKKTTTGKTANVFWSILKNASNEIVGFAFNKFAEIEGVFDIGFKTRFMGGILQPILEANTDFDTITIPNTYTLKNALTAGYSNCPISNGTGSLTIEECGEEGQLHQIVKVCSKTNPLVYERFYHATDNVWGWGEWVNTSSFGGRLLWNGGYYMTKTHIATLSQKVSEQPTGIVLVFSKYVASDENNQIKDYAWNEFFIPKYVVNNYDGKGHSFFMSDTVETVGFKYLYLYDDKITGHASNDTKGTTNGITYNNTSFILRYVIGV